MSYQRLTDDIKAKFISLAIDISPENLSCDGEAPASYRQTRYKALMAEWKSLENTVGMKVTEEMVWKWDTTKGGTL